MPTTKILNPSDQLSGLGKIRDFCLGGIPIEKKNSPLKSTKA